MGIGTDPESTSDAQLGLKAALSSACEFSAQHLGSGALAWAEGELGLAGALWNCLQEQGQSRGWVHPMPDSWNQDIPTANSCLCPGGQNW